jgi:hypothetical protein
MASQEADRAFREHESTYHRFIGLMKYGAIISVIVAFLVVLIIAN